MNVKMGIKSIEQIREDFRNGKIKSNDAVLLKLGEVGHHHPVGYIWDTSPENPLKLYQTSGTATTPDDEEFEKINNLSVDISKGDYLGYPIIGYEFLKRVEEA